MGAPLGRPCSTGTRGSGLGARVCCRNERADDPGGTRFRWLSQRREAHGGGQSSQGQPSAVGLHQAHRIEAQQVLTHRGSTQAKKPSDGARVGGAIAPCQLEQGSQHSLRSHVEAGGSTREQSIEGGRGSRGSNVGG